MNGNLHFRQENKCFLRFLEPQNRPIPSETQGTQRVSVILGLPSGRRIGLDSGALLRFELITPVSPNSIVYGTYHKSEKYLICWIYIINKPPGGDRRGGALPSSELGTRTPRPFPSPARSGACHPAPPSSQPSRPAFPPALGPGWRRWVTPGTLCDKKVILLEKCTF